MEFQMTATVQFDQLACVLDVDTSPINNLGQGAEQICWLLKFDDLIYVSDSTEALGELTQWLCEL